jgi:hypothetical protein
MEGRSDFGVHLYGEATFHHELLVPQLDLGLHPVREGFVQDGGADVANPLLGHLPDLFPIWKKGLNRCLG